MKIAIINRHPRDALGGSEMQCGQIAAELTARGHQVCFVSPLPASAPQADYSGLPYQVVRVEANAAAIIKAVAAFGPNVAYWRLNKYYLRKVVTGLKKRGISLIFAVSHIDDLKRFTANVNPRAGVVDALKWLKQLAKSAYNYSGFRHVAGVTTLNTDFIPLIPVANYAFIPNAVAMEYAPFNWPRPFVLWVSNLKPAKRPELFIKLAEELKDTGADFLMVGATQSANYGWVKDHKPGNFHYLGGQDIRVVNSLCAQCLYLVHTCKPEGFGNIFLQAWLNHKPSVTLGFDACGYIEAHGLGGNAKEDWPTFVALNRRLLEDEKLRKQVGEKAYTFAHSTFSVQASVDKLIAFIESTLNTSR